MKNIPINQNKKKQVSKTMKIKSKFGKEIIYQLEKDGVKGFYTRNEIYLAIERAEKTGETLQ